MSEEQLVKPLDDKHPWRIEMFYHHHRYRTIEHDSADYEAATSVIGGLCLSVTTDKIDIYLDNKLYRVIEVRSHDLQP